MVNYLFWERETQPPIAGGCDDPTSPRLRRARWSEWRFRVVVSWYLIS